MQTMTNHYVIIAAAVAQWNRAFAPHVEGWVFEFQPRQTRTGSDSSTAKRSAIGASVGDHHDEQMPSITVGVAR